MKLIKFNDFVRQANFFSKTMGIRPYDEPGFINSHKNTYVYRIIMCYVLMDLIFALLCELVFVIISFKNGENFVEAITTLTYFGFGIVGCFKIITILRHKPQLSKLASELHELIPKTLKSQNDMKCKSYLRQCTLLSAYNAALNMALDWSYNLSALFQWLFFGAERALPYIMKIPWNYDDNWSYYLTYVLQASAGYFCTAGQIIIDLLLFALATQVIMHYDNIARSIASYELKADAPAKSVAELKYQHDEDLLFLYKMIDYHERVLRLSDILNDVFGVPLLINFLTSSFVICFVGFQMALFEFDLSTMAKLFLFMSSSLLQVYLICHYGQQLIDSSSNIANAVFSHNWTNADLRYKQILSLIIARAQKPSILKATSFVVVSRNTMAGLMKISYNFFALLQTMYSD